MKVFLDANVLIDLFDGSAKYHQIVVDIFSLLRKKKCELFIAPSTFVIINHILFKVFRNRTLANKKMKSIIEYFKFTTEDQMVMNKVYQCDFSDLEDAVQYFSAINMKPDFIITHNKKDFPTSEKNVVDIHQFAAYMNYGQ